MSLIPKSDAETLRQHLDAHLTAPVIVDYFTRPPRRVVVPGDEPCETCEETQLLLEEVASLSDRIQLRVHDLDTETELAGQMGVDRAPAIVLRGAAKGRVRYLGIPAGHEFGSFLGDLIDVASGETDLSPGTKAALQGIERDIHIQVFVTPTCPFCPGAARLAHKLAVESGRVTADVVEASEFPDLVQRYNVHGVPKVVINEHVEFVGAQPESRFVRELLRAAA